MAPAPVDHDARRAQLTAVLLDVVDERGLEGASIRALASAAGVSIGAVQHYFPTKDALLRHAYRQIEAELEGRIEARLVGVTDAREAIRVVLEEFLPLDAPRMKAIRVATAFGVRALHSPALADELRDDLVELRQIVTGAFAEAGVAHAEREAVTAIALVDGLTEQLLFEAGGFGPADAVAVLDAHLARVFGEGE